MSNGIQTITPTELLMPQRFTFADMQQMAQEVGKSGLFKMTGPQILTLMLLADSEGIHPIQALMRWDIIDGRPAKKAATVLAEFQAKGGIVTWVKNSDTECEGWFSHPRTHPDPLSIKYTMADAQRAGLAHKDNWRKNPSDMLTWRVAVRGVRRVLPGAIVGIYDPDEMPEPPKALEAAAHESLREKLRAKRVEREARAGNGQRAEHQAVAETVAELKAANGSSQPAEAPEAAPEAPKSDFRKWVDEQVIEVNRELVKPISAFQIANHVLKVGIDEALIDPTHITNTDGKRDKQAAAAVLGALWDEDGPWVLDVVGRYLAQKVAEAHVAAGGADLLPTPPPVQQALPV